MTEQTSCSRANHVTGLTKSTGGAPDRCQARHPQFVGKRPTNGRRRKRRRRR